MYSYVENECGRWDILDPDGDFIAAVLSEAAAEALLSHLNRYL